MALQEHCVQTAVEKNFGSSAQVLRWNTRDFTEKGDNYATVVTSIEVEVELVDVATDEDGECCKDERKQPNHKSNPSIDNRLQNFEHQDHLFSQGSSATPGQKLQEETGHNIEKYRICSKPYPLASSASNVKKLSYVVKYLADREDGPLRKVLASIHEREVIFFTKIAPRLNDVLRSINVSEINIPTCYYSNCEYGKELLINEDMRRLGYAMADRKAGMSPAQVTDVLRELARLHAASYILREKGGKKENFEETYPCIRDLFKDEHDDTTSVFFEGVYQGNMTGSIKLLSAVDGYGEVVDWLKKASPNIISLLTEQLNCSNDHFFVICHGDTWNNNFLFK